MDETIVNCKLCSTELKTSDYIKQGYCMSCANKFSRYAGPNNRTDGFTHSKAAVKSIKRCQRCGDAGHIDSECRTKICSFCNTRGHDAKRCFSNPENCCAKCGVFGHTISNCVVCDRCGDAGHAAIDCRTKICDDCGKRGHLATSCWHSKTCERCGIKGHIAEACRSKLWCEKCKQPHKRCDEYVVSNNNSDNEA